MSVGDSWGAQESGRPQAVNLWRVSASGPPEAEAVSFDLLSAPLGVSVSPESPPGSLSFGSNFSGGSQDFSHIVFSSSRRLILEAPEEFPGVGENYGRYLYEWVAGQLRLVNVLPDGSPTALAALGYGNAALSPSFYPGEFAVSADGSRIFFADLLSPAETTRELYVREEDPGVPGGRATVHVSASERTDCAEDPTCGGDSTPDPAPDTSAPKAASFQAAARDREGPAFFISPQKLTDEATASNDNGIGTAGGSTYCASARCGLYRWEPSAAGGSGHLEDLTVDAATGGGVLGTVGASPDGSRVYFVAIAAMAGTAIDGQPNVYVWQQGQGISFIATLDGEGNGGLAADEGVWSRLLTTRNESGENNFGGGVRASDNGRYLVFRSRARITEYDNAGRYQLYRYDAQDASLVCISCNSRTGASTGNAYLKQENFRIIRPSWVSRNIASDGSVVFDSDEPLVPGDVNGVSDVYEWSSGQVRLVSSGKGVSGSKFLDASKAGEDLFFTTRDRLISSDRDDLIDLYDARVGGGFPEPPPRPECQGEGCLAAPTAPPGIVRPAPPAVDATPDRPKSKPKKLRCKRGFVKKKVRGKTRCVKKSKRGGRGAGRRGR